MLTLKERVEDRIGSVSDDEALASWLNAGAKLITNLLPEQRLEKYTVPLTDAGSGVNIQAYRVLSANKAGYGAVRVGQHLIARVADSASIYSATTEFPAWYILNGLAYVKPSGGTVIAMGFPEVYTGDYAITNFPADVDETVVLYAAIQGRMRQINDMVVSEIDALTFTTYTIPTAPSAPSFIYIDANGEVISSTSITFANTLNFIQPAFTGSYTNTDNALGNQDVELAGGHLSKIQTQLAEMQNQLAVSGGQFNKDKVEFDAALQVAIDNAQLTQQRLLTSAQLAQDLSKTNEAMKLSQQVQEYASALQLYGQQVNAYSAQLQQEVARISQEINIIQIKTQQYSAILPILIQEFQTYIKAL